MAPNSNFAAATLNLNRRDFLARLSAAALTTSISSLPGADPLAANRRLRVGFLGATHPHVAEKLDVLRTSPDYEFVGVCEESPAARADWEKQGVTLFSQEDLLHQCDIVDVESPVRDHFRHTIIALEAGKHVHLEKPPTTTLRQLRRVVSVASERKRLVQVGYMWRYHPGFRRIFEAVRQGWLGDIFMVKAEISNLLAPERRPQWAQFKGGALFDLGSHMIDAVVRLLGRPKGVTPFLRRHGSPVDDLNDNNVVVLEYERALAVITNAAMQPTSASHRCFEVLGPNGSATLRPIEPPALEVELAAAAGPYKPGKQNVKLPAYKRYEADFAELAAAVREDRSLPVPPGTELDVQETLLRASQML